MRVLILFLHFFVASAATADTSRGPCREWLWPCEGGRWICGPDEAYQRYLHEPQPGCPVTNIPPDTPVTQCQLVQGTCQYTNSTLECSVWVPDCGYSYTCGSVEERAEAMESTNCGGRTPPPPPPDELCLPVNSTCQWFNPCQYWRGHCLGSYRCGTLDQYYAFIFGPIPSCAYPPEGWVEPKVPGECVIQDQQCNWSNCTAYLDWCQTSWMCGSQHEKDVYLAGPPPPCPAPPPGHTPPPLPGVCQFNITRNRCQFQEVDSDSDPCILGSVVCDQPNHVCVVDSSSLRGAVCVPVCAGENGGCRYDQICVERPYCSDCEGRNIMEGYCQDIIIEYDDPCVLGVVRCEDPNTICVVNSTSPNGAVCLRKCAVNNGSCKEDQVCLERPYCNDCTIMEAYCQTNQTDIGTRILALSCVMVGFVVLQFGVLTGVVLLFIASYKRHRAHRNRACKKENLTHELDDFKESDDRKYLGLEFENSTLSSEISDMEKKDLSLE